MVSFASLHFDAHFVPTGCLQAPPFTPSQLPAHVVPAPPHAGRAPFGAPVTGAQVPTDPVTSHASHCPVHGTLQQTPSAQKPLSHTLASVHAAPAAIFGTHTEPEQ
jgi:hypothetical protein